MSESREERARRVSQIGNTKPPVGENKTPINGKQPPKKRTPKLEGQLRDFFAGCALTVQLVGDDFSAQIIASRGDELAKAWSDLAAKNPSVDRVLKTLVEGSAWTQVTVVSLSVIVPIAWHHQLIPDSIGSKFAAMVGVPSSDEVKEHSIKTEPTSGYRSRGKNVGGTSAGKSSPEGK